MADPYPEDKYPVTDAFIKQDITPPKTALPIDDYMIALAKISNANFIADVSSIPKEEAVQPFPATIMAKYFHWKPNVGLTLIDLTQQSKMSLLRYDANTFLFWMEPDAVQLASQAVKETETDFHPKYNLTNDLYNIVTKQGSMFPYDKLDHLPAEGKVVDIPLQELPVDQRKKAFGIIKQLSNYNELFSRVWFSDEFWKTAAIRFIPGNSSSEGVPFLQVSGSYHQIPMNDSLIGLQAQEKPDDKSN